VATFPRVSSTLVKGLEGLVDGGTDAVASAFFGDRPDNDAGSGIGERAGCDRAALEGMYGELAPRIHRFQRDLLGDAALATDATQETFIRAFRRVGDVPPGTRLAPWVFGIARNVSLEQRRARGRFRRVVVEASPSTRDAVPDRAARSPEAALLDREALTIVERALAALSEERRAALLLRLDHGLAYEDIAQTMGWSLAKVKVEIFRAREVLRATLEEYRGGLP
jgi:RNA polymerase sigma-70 factor (ECF subfamily)